MTNHFLLVEVLLIDVKTDDEIIQDLKQSKVYHFKRILEKITNI